MPSASVLNLQHLRFFCSFCLFTVALFTYWLHWVFVAAALLFCLILQCTGVSLQWLLLLQIMASRLTATVTGARRFNSCGAELGCSSACGIFPNQGLNPCPQGWQADLYTLYHQGSPIYSVYLNEIQILALPLVNYLSHFILLCCIFLKAEIIVASLEDGFES